MEKRDIHPRVVEALLAFSLDLQCDVVRISRKKIAGVFGFGDFLERVLGAIQIRDQKFNLDQIFSQRSDIPRPFLRGGSSTGLLNGTQSSERKIIH